jgi:hypothetical protein
MRLIKDSSGRFAQRPHYAPAELDRECETIITAFLQEKYGSAEYPVSTDDLASLVEQEAQDLDLYADLREFGEGVEGVTIFVPGEAPKVKISQLLTESAARQNRLRTTLTHEFGHVHFHSYLFEEKVRSPDLFANAALPRGKSAVDNVQVCKRDTMLDANRTDWMEWQAGHVCGAILMPGMVLRQLVRDFVAAAGATPHGSLELSLVAAVASRFQVSAEAARVRLMRLNLVAPGQPSGMLFS